MTPTPAPACITPYDYTPAGKQDAFVRGYVLYGRNMTTDYTGCLHMSGRETARKMMREEGN